MDSNHDIVPTLRLNGGVYMSFAADEIERLRAKIVLLESCADTSLIPGAVPTHRCKVCGAYWRKWIVDGEASWKLNSRGCGECCDNAAMGDQIEALVSPAKVGGDEREAFETWCKQEFPGLEVRVQNLLGTYTKSLTEWLYTGWQARAALSADGGEPHREAKVGPLIYEACGSLPEGWRVRIEFENGYGGVVLVDPYDEERDMHADRDAPTIAEQLHEAINAAIAAKAKGDES